MPVLGFALDSTIASLARREWVERARCAGTGRTPLDEHDRPGSSSRPGLGTPLMIRHIFNVVVVVVVVVDVDVDVRRSR